MPDRVPVAFFCYNRSRHLQATLESYDACVDRERTRPYIFCDGPKTDGGDAQVEAAREVARSWAAVSGADTEFAPANRGLSASVSSGVTRLIEEHGRVIVVEDDLLLHPLFLRFHLDGLDRYEDEPQVYQIAGNQWMNMPMGTGAFFVPFTTTWGWSTWRRAWDQFDPSAPGSESLERDAEMRRKFDLGSVYPYSELLRHTLAGETQSWGILWYWTVFSRGGQVLYPPFSLVTNTGFDGSGTNCSGEERRSPRSGTQRGSGRFRYPARVKSSRIRQMMMIRAIGRLSAS